MSIVDLERESLTGINSRQAAPLDGAAGGGLYSADLGLLIIFQANSFDQAQLGFQPVDVLSVCELRLDPLRFGHGEVEDVLEPAHKDHPAKEDAAGVVRLRPAYTRLRRAPPYTKLFARSLSRPFPLMATHQIGSHLSRPRV